MNQSTACSDSITNVNITNSQRVTIILAVTCSVLAVFIAGSNIIIVVALCRQRALTPQSAQRISGGHSRPPSQLLMVSMAVSDAIIGLLSMPLGVYVIVNNGRWALGKNMCSAWNWLDKVLCTVSIYHVAFMALDRYFAVCRPLMYHIMSKNTTLCLIALSWALPAVISTVLMAGGWHQNDVSWMATCLEMAGACAPVYNRPYLIAVSTLDFYVPILVIFILYFMVAREIYRRRKKSVSISAIRKLTLIKTKSVITFVRSANKNFQNVDPKENRDQQVGSACKDRAIDENRDEKHASKTKQTVWWVCAENHLVKSKVSSYISGAIISGTDPSLEINPSSLDINSLDLFVSVEQGAANEGVTQNSSRCSNNLSPSAIRNDSTTSKEIESEMPVLKNNLTGEINNVDVNPQTRSWSDEVILDSRTLKSEISLLSKSPFTSTYVENVRSSNVTGIPETHLINTRQKYVLNGEGCDVRPPSQLEVPPTRTSSKQRSSASKAFTTIGCIVVCFTICWLPFSIYNFVYINSGFDMASWPSLLFMWMGYANSALNPIFYCFTHSVRQAVLAIMKKPK